MSAEICAAAERPSFNEQSVNRPTDLEARHRVHSGSWGLCPVPLAGGPSRDLGAGLRSSDKRLVASIEAQRAVVRTTDGDSEFMWSEPGYTPTAAVAFTRGDNDVVLDAATGALRLISRKGAPTVSLSPTGLLPGTSRDFRVRSTLTLVTSGALLRWCQGACNKGFHIIPLSGAAAQHFPFASCQIDRIDLQVSYVFVDPSRELIVGMRGSSPGTWPLGTVAWTT